MERIEGRALESAREVMGAAPEDLTALGRLLIEHLVMIADLDPQPLGLTNLGRAGFVQRQVERWTRQWLEGTHRPIAALSEVARRLQEAASQAKMPTDPPNLRLVHGDFNLGNILVAVNSYSHIEAILDWEMATLGHPLADFGAFLAYSGAHTAKIFAIEAAVSDVHGFPSEMDFISWYVDLTGADETNIAFFRLLALLKIIVISETIRDRELLQPGADPTRPRPGDHSEELAEVCLHWARQARVLQ
jgi:aminoglycoside phosphotransferase (APT) family kinase protein